MEEEGEEREETEEEENWIPLAALAYVYEELLQTVVNAIAAISVKIRLINCYVALNCFPVISLSRLNG